jgi:predicted MFS family arabinose efflux permease
MTAAVMSKTRDVFLYFSPLTFIAYLALPHGYLLDIASTYMLKNQLHASVTEISTFRLLTAIPLYLSFVFGLTRDLWNPLGLRDRGYFLVFAPLTAVVFLWMAVSQLTYSGLFLGMLIVMFLFRFVMAAYQGLMALIGQQQLMSGRLSVVWNIFWSLPYVIGALASGWVAEHLRPAQTFVVMAVLCIALALFGLWKPRAVFENVYDKPLAKGSDLLNNIRRLAKHRAAWLAVIIMFMFQFAPGANTPLQFYLTNTLHASDAIYGYYYAVFAGAFIPVYLLYGWLCKRYSLEKLLWWGMIITVPQMVPLVFIHSGVEAVWWALPIGMMGGVAAVALYDFSMRACPPGLQGTLMMMVDGVYQLSYRGGDVVGSWIYASSPAHGFLYCVLATTGVYALILPLLFLIPRELIATRDGEANPVLEVEVLVEIAETEPA